MQLHHDCHLTHLNMISPTVKPLVKVVPNSKTQMFLVSSCSCLRFVHWSHVLSWEWRCSWSSADRRCSNYIWVITNCIAYKGATYIRGFTVGLFIMIYAPFFISFHFHDPYIISLQSPTQNGANNDGKVCIMQNSVKQTWHEVLALVFA